MTTTQLRRTIVAITAAMTLALSGCGEDDSAAQATANTSDSPAASDSPTAEKSKEPSSEPPAADGVVLDVTVSGEDVSPMAQAVEVGVGETLALEVESDRTGELHVHSTPEQMVEFGSGTSRHELSFEQPGSVDIEEHESGALVARVLVR